MKPAVIRDEQHYVCSENTLYCQKLESLSYVFAADSMGLSGFVFTHLLSKVTVSDARHTGVKTEFNVKWSFKVIQGHVF